MAPKGSSPPVLDPQSPEDWPRVTQMVFRAASPASGSAGGPPKAMACSRGDGLCRHTRHQEGTPACDRVWARADKLTMAHSTAQATSTLQGQVVWAEPRQVWKRFDLASVLPLDFPLLLHSELSHTEF